MNPHGSQQDIKALKGSPDAVGVNPDVNKHHQTAEDVMIPQKQTPSQLPFQGSVEDKINSVQEDTIRSSWLSFASSNRSRDSAVPSLFSARASTLSAATRYSIHDSVLESPIPASPLNEFEEPCFDLCPRYWCTFCDASFDSKTDWKLHELELHDRKEQYHCRYCSSIFSRAGLLVEHESVVHSIEQRPNMAESVRYSSIRSAWGCGFCAAFISSRNDYLEHVGRHYDEGKGKSEWQHTRVIEALLHQPKVQEAWTEKVMQEEKARGAKLRFSWDPNTTGRSLDHEPPKLQDLLEFFSMGKRSALEVATAAFDAARIRTETNVSTLVSKLFLRTLDPKPAQSPDQSPKLGPSAIEQSLSREDSSPMSPLPPLMSFPSGLRSKSAEELSPFKPTFLDLTALSTSKRAAPDKQDVMEGKKYIPSSTRMESGGSYDPLHHLSSHFCQLRTLHRVESDRNLALSDHSPASGRSFSARQAARDLEPSWPKSAIRAPLISIRTSNEHSGIRITRDIKGLKETQLHNNTLLKPGTPPVRPHASSDALSTFTSSSSSTHYSSPDMTADDSLSEQGSWLESDSGSVIAEECVTPFYLAVNRGMRSLWASYNSYWAAIIHQCAGERGHGSPPSRVVGGRVQKSSSSWRGAGKGGLRPAGRLPRDDDDEEEEDDEGYRPPLSLARPNPSGTKRFACPFRKHDPQTYNIRDHEVCAIRSWTTISRLKEHLYRRHYTIHCQRCKQTFDDSKELADHERAVIKCEVNDLAHPGDITTDQEKKLKSRKHTSRKQSDEDKWRDIYQLLFPNEEVPSPYPEVAEDVAPILTEEDRCRLTFQHFLLTEMPRIFTRAAEELAGRHMQPQDAIPMESISKLLQDSLRRAFKAWEDRGNNVPTADATAVSQCFLPDTPVTTASYTLAPPLDTHQAIPYPAVSNGSFLQLNNRAELGLIETISGSSPDGPAFTATTGCFITPPSDDLNAFAPDYNTLGRLPWEANFGLTGTSVAGFHAGLTGVSSSVESQYWSFRGTSGL